MNPSPYYETSFASTAAAVTKLYILVSKSVYSNAALWAALWTDSDTRTTNMHISGCTRSIFVKRGNPLQTIDSYIIVMNHFADKKSVQTFHGVDISSNEGIKSTKAA